MAVAPMGDDGIGDVSFFDEVPGSGKDSLHHSHESFSFLVVRNRLFDESVNLKEPLLAISVYRHEETGLRAWPTSPFDPLHPTTLHATIHTHVKSRCGCYQDRVVLSH